jgi:hypothetical protein
MARPVGKFRGGQRRLYEAVALGLTDRAIQRASGGLCPLPPPLTAEQRAAIPRVVKMTP